MYVNGTALRFHPSANRTPQEVSDQSNEVSYADLSSSIERELCLRGHHRCNYFNVIFHEAFVKTLHITSCSDLLKPAYEKYADNG